MNGQIPHVDRQRASAAVECNDGFQEGVVGWGERGGEEGGRRSRRRSSRLSTCLPSPARLPAYCCVRAARRGAAKQTSQQRWRRGDEAVRTVAVHFAPCLARVVPERDPSSSRGAPQSRLSRLPWDDDRSGCSSAAYLEIFRSVRPAPVRSVGCCPPATATFAPVRCCIANCGGSPRQHAHSLARLQAMGGGLQFSISDPLATCRNPAPLARRGSS
ncbi:hypothetical protein K458DRAFT_485892 [Lentithecium fluviatile CBS 122367]|uniref:Uncharacterized protein n=1 Tax=Lentithecium fluviatile CBS 122367 TaxID=1168545 RepID=A0A6G1J912_9PLEO|nr:hypothetical protein K458DRAFT_485892 [Lentithecium fluviatile CBS 122367]